MYITDIAQSLRYSRREKEPPHLFHHPEWAAERKARPPTICLGPSADREDSMYEVHATHQHREQDYQ